MAFENVLQTFPFTAEAALSATDYRFVKSGTTPDLVDICGAGEQMIGIRRNSPAINLPVEVVLPGSIARLTIGTGGCTKGAHLKSGSAGEGIATTTDKDFVGAIALEAGDENDVISVVVTLFTETHA
jgi:hypothetical protein